MIQIGTLLLFAAVVVVFAWALMRCRVDLGPEGIMMVNGFTRHAYAWPQVVAVTMGPGHPWAVLDLSDGTSVSAVAIQGGRCTGDGTGQPGARVHPALRNPSRRGAHGRTRLTLRSSR